MDGKKHLTPPEMREILLSMKREGKPEAEIAEAVGRGISWVSSTWHQMRKVDPRAAAFEPMRGGGRKSSARPASDETPRPPPASDPAWDFSHEDLDLPGGEGAQ